MTSRRTITLSKWLYGMTAILMVSTLLIAYISFRPNSDARLFWPAVVTNIVGALCGALAVSQWLILRRLGPRIVALSFNQIDSEKIAQFKEVFRSRDIEVSFPYESVAPGESLQPTVGNAIAEADIILVFLSKDSTTSSWLDRDMRAVRKSQPKIIPVLLDAESRNNIPKILRPLRAVDATHSLFDAADEVARAIEQTGRRT